MTATTSRARRRPVEYNLYYAVVFAVALPVAVVRRLLPRERGFLDGRTEATVSRRRGVIGDARALTDSVIPYLFMG